MFRQFLFLNSAQTAQPEERENERRVLDPLFWFQSVDENEAGQRIKPPSFVTVLVVPIP